MIGFVVVLATGYVLGTKAGRERYEQIVGTARAVAAHPATKTMIDAGRRKIAGRISPDPPMVRLTEIHPGTTVMEPENLSDQQRSRRLPATNRGVDRLAGQ